MDTRAQLEAAIDENPDQAAAYLVLADWLQQQRDPRGELIVLASRRDMESQTKHEARLQQQIGPDAPRRGRWHWFHGFVQSVDIYFDNDDVEWFRAFVNHPSMRHATKLEFALWDDDEDERQWVIDAISEQSRPCCRELEIQSELSGHGNVPFGELDLGGLWTALPGLTSLRVRARYMKPGSLASSSLTSLFLDGEVSHADLRPLLEGSAPNVRALDLTDVDRKFGEAIADSPLAAQLEKLTLPYVDDQERLKKQLPYVTFHAQEDGDRYEPVAE